MTEPDSTTHRRDLLLVLLSRVERGVLTEAERPLLRPLVEAEIAHGQATIDRYAADTPWLKAAAEDHEALKQQLAETRRLADEAATSFDARRIDLANALLRSLGSPWAALIDQAAIVQADNARLYGELDALIAARPTSVSDVLVQHDVTRKALADALKAGWHLNWQQLVEAAGRTSEAAEKAQKRGDRWKAKAQEIEADRDRLAEAEAEHDSTRAASGASR